MKTIVALFAAAALVGLATPAAAQPPGSYRDSCRDIRMQGSVLTACVEEVVVAVSSGAH